MEPSNQSQNNIIFGQIVIGPAGSGKTTYCASMYDYLKNIGRRVFIINMDPGNDVSLSFKPDIDIKSLISLDDAMTKMMLGPNGGLIFCMEYLEANLDWLINKIKQLCFPSDSKYNYIIFDSPGQIELFIHHHSLKNIITKLTNRKTTGFDLRLSSVNLVDSFYTNDPGKFVAALLNSLSTMLHFSLPHVNVLSKIDLIEKYSKNAFNLEYYTDVLDLNYLVDRIIDDPFMSKHKNLSKTIAGIVQDYGLVKFVCLDVNKAETLVEVLNAVDTANGYFLVNFDKEQ